MAFRVEGFKQSASGKFLERMVTASKVPDLAERDEFSRQYRDGKVRMVLASRYMSLKPCGLDLYIEADKKIVWSLDSDSIVRQKVDLDWIDEEFEGEEK